MYGGSQQREDRGGILEIEVKLYAHLLKYSLDGETQVKLDVAEGTSIHEVLKLLRIPRSVVYVVLVNDAPAAEDQVLHAGDCVKLVPSVGGGS